MSRIPPRSIIEFAAVVLIAFGTNIVASFAYWIFIPDPVVINDDALVFVATSGVAFLAIVAIILGIRGWRPANLGLHFTPGDIGVGVLLGLAAGAANHVSHVVITTTAEALLDVESNPTAIVGEVSLPVLIPAMLVNAAYEEVLVNAYILVVLARMGVGLRSAVIGSVALRTSYHMYLGWAALVPIALTGWILTIWFARTGRIWPAVIGHALIDIAIVLYG